MQKRVLKVLGKNLRRQREQVGVKRPQLARLLRVSLSYVIHLENGTKNNPTLRILYEWARHTQSKIADLVKGL
jgi:transcriptional regulator with XRE-family HTH domain